MKVVRLVVVLAIMSAFFALASFATTTYVSQSGGSVSCGADGTQTTTAVASLTSGMYTAGAVFKVCGALTSSFPVLGNGASGNVIQVLFENNASIATASTTCPIIMNNHSHLLFDGGTACGAGTSCSSSLSGTAQLSVPNNGSGMATQNLTSAFCSTSESGDVEIRNFIVGPIYQHTSASDVTSSIDTETNMFYSDASAGLSGNLSIHDNTIHDIGVPIMTENYSNSPTMAVYNNDFYNYDWALGITPQSTTSAFTLQVHDNHFGSTTNWDTTADAFHHNGIHFFGYTNLATAIGVYNNLFDGDWGNCCATAGIYSEYHVMNNFSLYNNVFNQYNGNAYPFLEIGSSGETPGISTGTIVNNVFQCGSGASNLQALWFYGTSYSGLALENNVLYNCNTFVDFVNETSIPGTMDHNIYLSQGAGGNNAWSLGSGGTNTFSSWQSSCACDTHSLYSSTNTLNSNGTPTSSFPGLSTGTNPGINLTSMASGSLAALSNSTSAGNSVTPIAQPASGAWTVGAFSSTAVSGNTGASTPLPPTGVVATIVN